MNFTPFTSLETKNLHLRKLELSDAADLAKLRSDDIVNRYINRPKNITIEDAADFIFKTNKKIENKELLYWAITLKKSDALIGTTCLFNLSPEKEMGELGYELHPDFHGKGIMNEVLSTVINIGFKEMNLIIITALTKSGNLSSVKLLTKNNFILDKDFSLVSRDTAADYAVNEKETDIRPGEDPSLQGQYSVILCRQFN